MEILMNNCRIVVGKNPQTGDKVLQFIDQQGNVVTVSMSAEVAKNIATELASSIVIAQGALPSITPFPSGGKRN